MSAETLATFALLGLLAAPPPAGPRRVEVTAYCSCSFCTGPSSPERGGHGLTASGSRPVAGRTVAADPRFRKMGSWVTIKGLGRRRVEDTGSGIKGERLDVYMESHEAAVKFGRRRMWVQ